MATEKGAERVAFAALIEALDDPDWMVVREAVTRAEAWMTKMSPSDSKLDDLAKRIVGLAGHTKWEIRRGVANTAGQLLHPAFESALAKLSTDDNMQVRQAAERAALRRRDWQLASLLGKQHEDRINATLDGIEARYGRTGREAVRRASEQITDIFARELYHEVIKLITPLAASADRLRTQLAEKAAVHTELTEEAARVGARVAHLRSVLDGMRAYTQQPTLDFQRADLKDLVDEAIALVREARSNDRFSAVRTAIEVDVGFEVCRYRFVQALTNVLQNALEAYDGIDRPEPVLVRGGVEDGRVTISVVDFGCGMSKEAVEDAIVLFATNKVGGTGFGLPLAKKIIESEHRGRLTIESVKGKGTVVHLVVPIDSGVGR